MDTTEYPHYQAPFSAYNVAQRAVVPFLDQDCNIVISFQTAVGKCLQYDSRVVLSDGSYRKIGDICESKSHVEVLSLNTSTMTMEKSVAIPVIKEVSDDLLNIVVKSGNNVVTTREHPYLVKRENGIRWIQANELIVGDFIAVVRNIGDIVKGKEKDTLDFIRDVSSGFIKSRKDVMLVLSPSGMSKNKVTRKLQCLDGFTPKVIQRWRLSGVMPLTKYFEACDFLGISPTITCVKGGNNGKSFNVPRFICRDTAWLLGLIFGDGHLTRRFQLRISGIDNGVFDNIEKVLNDVFGTYSHKINQGVCLGSKPLAEFFHCMGIPVGKKSDIITVPQFILKATNEIVSGFIAGFFDADGHISTKGHIEMYSNSEEFIFGLQTLLLRFGIRSYKKEKMYNGKLRFRCCIYDADDVLIFRENIEVFDSKKAQRLKDVTCSKNTNDKKIPFSTMELRCLKNSLNTTYSELPVSISSVAGGSRKHISRREMRKFLDGVDLDTSLRLFLDGDVEFDKITSISSHIGEERVYDLTVDGNHNFIAENIVCHNTVLAEGAFGYHLQKDDLSKVAYVSPFKSLSQEKHNSWSENFQLSKYGVMLSTGDHTPNPNEYAERRLCVVTTESFDSKTRNERYQGWLGQMSCVVFDEAHLLSTTGRGAAMEAAMMRFSLVNPNARMILLSATMSNGKQVAQWVKSLNNKVTKFIHSDWRPTKLNIKTHVVEDGFEHKIAKAVELALKARFDKKIIVFVHSKAVGNEIVKRVRRQGVKCAFHNASLRRGIREKIERMFNSSSSGLNVLVSTSTLGAGVNLG